MTDNINKTYPCEAILYRNGGNIAFEQELIKEEPLMIRMEGNPYTVVMRTPGEERAHAAGFCLTEGIVESIDDFATLGHCAEMDPNVIEIRLTEKRLAEASDLLNRRGFISQTSCGLCGRELIKEIVQDLPPITDNSAITAEQALGCFNLLNDHQQFYKTTRGSHAALLCDIELNLISVAEDVGRHNALDKAIGKAFICNTLKDARIAVLSSRISYELVQKAARAGVPILLSVSRPTSFAVEIGKKLNMTLACTDRDSGLIILCGSKRLSIQSP